MPKGCEGCGRPIRMPHAEGCPRVRPQNRSKNMDVPAAEEVEQLPVDAVGAPALDVSCDADELKCRRPVLPRLKRAGSCVA
jgi:hypothetical protein